MGFAPKLTARILLAAALSATAVAAAESDSPVNLSNSAASAPAEAAGRGLERRSDTAAQSRNGTPKAAVTNEAQDLAIFALIGLGIVGLLWIRRHTSEL